MQKEGIILQVDPQQMRSVDYIEEFSRLVQAGNKVLLLQMETARKCTHLYMNGTPVKDTHMLLLNGMTEREIISLSPGLGNTQRNNIIGSGLWVHKNEEELMRQTLMNIGDITISGSVGWSRLKLREHMWAEFGAKTVEESNVNIGSTVFGVEEKERIGWGNWEKRQGENDNLPYTEESAEAKRELLRILFKTHKFSNTGTILVYIEQSDSGENIIRVVQNEDTVKRYGEKDCHFFFIPQTQLFSRCTGDHIVGLVHLKPI